MSNHHQSKINTQTAKSHFWCFRPVTYHMEWSHGSAPVIQIWGKASQSISVCQPTETRHSSTGPHPEHTDLRATYLYQKHFIWDIWAIFAILHVGHFRLTSIYSGLEEGQQCCIKWLTSISFLEQVHSLHRWLWSAWLSQAALKSDQSEEELENTDMEDKAHTSEQFKFNQSHQKLSCTSFESHKDNLKNVIKTTNKV